MKRDFQKLEKKWKRETQYISAPTPKYLHPSYARIIGLGPVAVRMILESLEREPDDWFYALRALTGVNPVTPSMAGDMRKMTAAWLKWGRERSLV